MPPCAQEDLHDRLHHARAGRAAQGRCTSGPRCRSPSTSARASISSSRSTAISCPVRQTCFAIVTLDYSSAVLPCPPTRRAHPQLLDHRAHRPRQVDARRSHPRGAPARSPSARRSDQFLDKMDLERERGITIKAQSVRLALHRPTTAQTYSLNLIDTPGHVDFHYEVSRSLAACEGALLVVDAAQGVEAQTLANVYLALDNNLDDRPGPQQDRPAVGATPTGVKQQIEDIIGLDASDALPGVGQDRASASTRSSRRSSQRIPPPEGRSATRRCRRSSSTAGTTPTAASSCSCASIDGHAQARATKIRFMAHRAGLRGARRSARSRRTRSRSTSSAAGRGRLRRRQHQGASRDTRVGDTITDAERPAPSRCPASRTVKPMVFAGLFPTDAARLRRAARRAREAARSTTRRSPTSPRPRWRSASASAAASSACCTWRSSRSGSSASSTSTSSRPRRRCATASTTTDGDDHRDRQPGEAARRRASIEHIEEPIIAATIHVPQEYVGAIITLCQERRGMQTGIDYAGDNRVIVDYDLPLGRGGVRLLRQAEDASRAATPRSTTSSPDYREADLVRLDLLVNGERVDALSIIAHRDALVQPRARAVRQDEGARPAADVRGRDPGGDRHARSSRARRSRRCARTSPPSATAATSRASGSSSRSRKKARSA